MALDGVRLLRRNVVLKLTEITNGKHSLKMPVKNERMAICNFLVINNIRYGFRGGSHYENRNS